MTKRETERFLDVLPQKEKGPEGLWRNFAWIAAVPRPSGSEAMVGREIRSFAEKRGFSPEIDSVGNILIRIPSMSGYEDAPGIILQGHLDMICEQEPGVPVNPAVNGVIPIVETSGQWLTADGTTLGADNGIGLAAMLALMDEDIPHSPLSLLFTVDEERGLRGVKKLAFDLSQYGYLINLDSEDVEEVTIGCAGGEDTVIVLPIEAEFTTDDRVFLKLTISGLKGGHSGIDIGAVGRERANAIKFLANLLSQGQKEVDFQLALLKGGTKRNIIPSQAEAILATPNDRLELAQRTLERIGRKMSGDFADEDSMAISSERLTSETREVLTPDSKDKIISLLLALPNGVQQWSQSIPGLVDTSTNLAVVETSSGVVKIRMMSRSNSGERLTALKAKIETEAREVLGISQASVIHEGGYPGWEPNPDSPLVQLAQKVYKELTGEQLLVTATHGGLECGLLGGKYPHLQMISIGPTIKDAHSTRERVNVASVGQFYRFLKELLTVVANS